MLLLRAVQEQFTTVVAQKQDKLNLFVTQTSNLFDLFLNNIPISLRDEYTCSTCQKFVENYGGIVTVASDGKPTPVMWNPEGVPALYVEAVSVIASVVARSPIHNA